MRRRYDFDELGRRYGFEARHLEKVCRISDLLEDLSNVPFLRDRLSLYGGTALTFIFSEEILRLSIDVDFNYRHLDDRDWGEVRDMIDERIKGILYSQGYERSDLAITATYPLGRITAQYRNLNGMNDSFMIEIGYMRRIPLLPEDAIGMFRHIGTGERFPIKTPRHEELFANKWSTLLYRGSSRDLFDVYQISKMNMDQEVFRKCAVVESLMRGLPKLYEVDALKVVEPIPIDSGLRNLLQADKVKAYDFNQLKREVLKFCKDSISRLTHREIEAIDLFYDERKFRPDLIDHKKILHGSIRNHPMIIRALETLS